MRKLAVLLASVLVVVGLGWTVTAHAQSNFRTGDDVTVGEGQVVDQTLFAYGRTIDVAGTVNGDIFCAGQNVTITGTVTGDVICAGQTVHVAGDVGGNVRVAGQNVTIAGTIARNLTVGGQSVVLDDSGHVHGDAEVGGQSVTLNGAIDRDLAAGATALTLSGIVARDVTATTADLTLGGNARIGGDLTYTSMNTLTRASGSHVGGTIARHNPPADHGNGMWSGAVIGGGFMMALYTFAAFLLIALALILLFPGFIHAATEVAVAAPWKTLLVGFLASIIVPVVILALMFTAIGVPLALLALLTWVVVVCVSVPFAAYYLGSLLLSKSTNNPIWMMLLGAAIILILFMIPIIGFLTWLVAMWFGLGIILLQFPRLPRPNYHVAKAK